MSEQTNQPLNPQDIEAYLLGVLPEERVASLDQALRDDATALQQFAEAMQVMSLVRQEFAGQAEYQAAHQKEPLLEDFNSLLKDLREREDAAQPISQTYVMAGEDQNVRVRSDKLTARDLASVGGYVLRKTLASKPAIITGVGTLAAAVLLLALFVINPFASNPPTPQGIADNTPSDKPAEPVEPILRDQAVATLTATHSAQWSGSPTAEGLTTGDALRPGQLLILTAGFAEITTNDGAVAILEAPVAIQMIDSDNALRLHSGKLVGICETESSKGFLVRTPHMDVTDLGTRFGVNLNEQGEVNTAVFDGEVWVKSSSAQQDQRAGVLVEAGQAINASSSGAVDAVPYPLRPDHGFLPTWRDINGRVQTTGQVRFFVSPPADIRPNELIDPDHIIVFQEQTAEIDVPLLVRTELGPSSPDPTHALVPTGTRVISYMVHFSPAKFVSGGGTKKQSTTTAKAEIAFPGRVLGLIDERTTMAETNESLGLDSVIYMDLNDKDYNNTIDSWPSDSFSITGEDQNILEIKLSAIVHSDQVRVLVEVPADDKP